jgi:hypothetical protein
MFTAPTEASDDSPLLLEHFTLTESDLRAAIMASHSFNHADMIQLQRAHASTSEPSASATASASATTSTSASTVAAIAQNTGPSNTQSSSQIYDWMETWSETLVDYDLTLATSATSAASAAAEETSSSVLEVDGVILTGSTQTSSEPSQPTHPEAGAAGDTLVDSASVSCSIGSEERARESLHALAHPSTTSKASLAKRGVKRALGGAVEGSQSDAAEDELLGKSIRKKFADGKYYRGTVIRWRRHVSLAP